MVVLNQITTREFISVLKNCAPPTGWPRKLAVANSGGPDSTCLLFLLNSVISEKSSPNHTGCLRSLLSITVDHQLQACSTEMSDHAARVAASLGVEHLTRKIPWSTAQYGPKPLPGQSVEHIARIARYTVLFECINANDAHAIAFGHQADDQVETVLMRIAKSTSVLGLGGMKSVKRFGMGSDEGKMGYFGYTGMNRWIIRPLLSFPKDRILATCETNKLEYVTDPTNFQPELSLRNALRHALSKGSGFADENSAFSQDLKKLPQNLENLGIPSDLSTKSEVLYNLVQNSSIKVANLQKQAIEGLNLCISPSPPSSILLLKSKLSLISDPEIRLAMITTILRYVSHRPWGSPRAEASRDSKSLNSIISNIWSSHELAQQKTFTSGAGVLWTPVFINDRGQLKQTVFHGASNGWLATRAPPYRKLRSNTVDLDITDKIRNASQHTIKILYDCRFMLTFDIASLPKEVHYNPATTRVIVIPVTRYVLPQIVLRSISEEKPDLVLGSISCPDPPDIMDIQSVGKFEGAPWASWEFIRQLSYI